MMLRACMHATAACIPLLPSPPQNKPAPDVLPAACIMQLKGLHLQLNDDHRALGARYEALHEERINVERQYQVGQV